MKHYKEADDLLRDINAREERIRKAYREKHWYEFVAAFTSLTWTVFAGGALYLVSGAWKDQ